MRILGILIAIICTVGAIAFATLAAHSPDIAPNLLLGVMWLSWPAVAIVALLLLTVLIRRVWKHIAPVFGDNTAARLLALGAVSLVFSDTVRSVVVPFVRFTVELLFSVPGALSRFVLPVRSDGAPLPMGDQAPLSSFESFPALLAQPFENLGNNLLYINFAWLFIALAAWALLGQILSSAMRTSAGQGVESPWAQLLQRASSAPAATWHNVLLFGVIALGGLLSVSALITLPLLSQSNPLSTDDLKRIQGELEGVTKVSSNSALASAEFRIPEDLQRDLDALTVRIENERKRQHGLIEARTLSAGTSPPASAPDPMARDVSDDSGVVPMPGSTYPNSISPEVAISVLDTLEQDRQRVIREARSQWTEYQKQLLNQIEVAQNNAVLAVQRQNYAPGGTGSEYVAEVSSWLRETVSASSLSADYCHTNIRRGIDSFLARADFDLDSLAQGYSVTWDPPRRFECFLGGFYRTQPAEHELTLGAFGFSKWLIELDSLPLTLIAGMLGFGLVGAAVSSVIRERQGRAASDPLVSDITGILVRGLSATIVVYLAVKGGLVIFTAGSAGDPDPHVLLLTCLIASVFSEDVWAAARERFLSKVRNKQQDDAVKDAPKEQPQG